MTTAAPVLLDAEAAATYANVRPATLRVWRHRHRLTPYHAADGTSRYALDELAAILTRRSGETIG